MKIQNGQYPSINQLQDEYFGRSGSRVTKNDVGISFQEILNQKTGAPVKFSKHATNRLADRNINLTGDQLDRLNEGTRKAGAKGIQESLVLVDELAFIVNVPNNTVITAMDQDETNENVFTNIDGAVIM
ncbi:MAG: TIGR02530 family flagellar biosynthesis protein [Lachnospiraceae bacterium]|nr:TIGR02530 family flagellar biosynthesis protein [Lachnospiraceae bacterium]